MRAQVVCRVRQGSTLTFKVKEEESFLGRDPGIAVPIPMDGVSRKHARILWDGRSYWIEDMQSTNGTFLNGQAVQKEKLRHLDVITLGKKANLLFMVRDEEAQVAKRPCIVRAALVAEGEEELPHELGMGEFTIGRSSTCNIEAENGAVSKVHAKLERKFDELVIHDLGSSNGTFVNGVKVKEATLQNGDVVSLAAAENYRVVLDMGEATMGSGAYAPVSPAAPAPAAQDKPRLSAEWKTRFEWDPAELAALADVQRLASGAQAAKDTETKQKTGPTPVARRPAAASPTPAPPSKAAPAPPSKAAPPPAAKGATPTPPAKPVAAAPPGPALKPATPRAPTEHKPEPPATILGVDVSSLKRPQPPTGAPPPAPPAAAVPPRPTPALAPRPAAAPASPPAAPPAVAAPAPPAVKPAAPPAPAPPAPVPPQPSASPAASPELPTEYGGPTPPPRPAAAGPPTRPIAEIRLTGIGHSFVVATPGAHEMGRSREAALQISNATVSRKHARLILSDDRAAVYVQDTGGANGTLVNGAQIKDVHPISDGDVIQMGEVQLSVSLRRG